MLLVVLSNLPGIVLNRDLVPSLTYRRFSFARSVSRPSLTS